MRKRKNNLIFEIVGLDGSHESRKRLHEIFDIAGLLPEPQRSNTLLVLLAKAESLDDHCLGLDIALYAAEEGLEEVAITAIRYEKSTKLPLLIIARAFDRGNYALSKSLCHEWKPSLARIAS